PARAAINESVELTKAAKKRSAATLVNATLRRSEAGAKITISEVESSCPPDTSLPEKLGTVFSHPTWLVERWLTQFGEARTRTLLQKNNSAPRLTCSVLDPEDMPSIAKSLKRDHVSVKEGHWLKSTLTIAGGNPSNTETFRCGDI